LERANVEEIASRVETLRRLTKELLDSSDGFPAVNRNAKRVLASLEMIRINVEEAPE
jgi:hypothetical protein